jgi:hypothetical protein
MQRIPDRIELDRIAKFGEQLYLSCHRAARKPERDITPVLDKLDEITARPLGKVVRQGKLLAAAEFFVDPWTRCQCGLRFLAQVEEFLAPSDIQRLKELWEVQVDLHAEITAFLAQAE